MPRTPGGQRATATTEDLEAKEPDDTVNFPPTIQIPKDQGSGTVTIDGQSTPEFLRNLKSPPGGVEVPRGRPPSVAFPDAGPTMGHLVSQAEIPKRRSEDTKLAIGKLRINTGTPAPKRTPVMNKVLTDYKLDQTALERGQSRI